MSYELVAEGKSGSLFSIDQYQNDFQELQRGVLQLKLDQAVSPSVISWLDDRLEDLGVPESKVTTSGNLISIHFRVEIPPLALIAIAIGFSIVLVAAVVAWKLYKMSTTSLVSFSFITLIAIVLGIFIVIYTLRIVRGAS